MSRPLEYQRPVLDPRRSRHHVVSQGRTMTIPFRQRDPFPELTSGRNAQGTHRGADPAVDPIDEETTVTRRHVLEWLPTRRGSRRLETSTT